VALPVRRAAAMTVAAHLEYLEKMGQLRLRRGFFGRRVGV